MPVPTHTWIRTQVRGMEVENMFFNCRYHVDHLCSTYFHLDRIIYFSINWQMEKVKYRTFILFRKLRESFDCARREFLTEILYKNIAIIAIQYGKFFFFWHLWRYFPYCWVKFTQVRLENFPIHISLKSPYGG